MSYSLPFYEFNWRTLVKEDNVVLLINNIEEPKSSCKFT